MIVTIDFDYLLKTSTCVERLRCSPIVFSNTTEQRAYISISWGCFSLRIHKIRSFPIILLKESNYKQRFTPTHLSVIPEVKFSSGQTVGHPAPVCATCT